MGDVEGEADDDTDRAWTAWLDGPSDRWLLAAGVVGLGLTAAVTNLAAGGIRLLAPMYLFVLVAGLLGGPLAGLATGALAMTVFQLAYGPLGAYSLAPILAMAEAGGLAGFLARLGFRERCARRPLPWLAVALGLGFGLTLVFSVVADVTEWALALAGMHAPYLGDVVSAGVAFNLPVALVNAPLFALTAGGAVALLEHLQRHERTRPIVRPVVERVDALGWPGSESV